MTTPITLPEVQEFIASFWYHYDQGQFDVLAAYVADDMKYLSRSDSGQCPFEELLAAELTGGTEVLAWLSQHRDENPYPLRHHATNIFRTGTDGEATLVRFYLYVNQVTNNVPFDVSSGVVDVAIRRVGEDLKFTSMTVVLDAEDSIPFAEHRTKLAATNA
ncbi:SnoaL-like domain-containing protein [Mycolicibacterium neoaurum]|uniref:nuclear transport factor 2 family protein n=1 Tax=Mycolicibacterium neoaurum TaxID=1795 RepID=UPI00055A69F2|nr:nuclear transport factor 2 family protein [Mycolicibacterium neoaurum]SDE02729.1 SnoaL-like domain-containing protein [Mycolicibacterium neoaurum]